MACFVSFLVVLTIVSQASLGEANAFLRAVPKADVDLVTVAEVEATLLAELAGSLSHGPGQANLHRLQDALRPLFNTLPKNEFGNLGTLTVRYALHRFFVKQHGWVVKGLDPSTGDMNATSPTLMLKERAPGHIQSLFDQFTEGKGLGLHELTVLAATLEHLIHDEAITRLRGAYRMHGMEPSQRITGLMLDEIVEEYTMVYMLGGDLATMGSEQFQEMQSNIAFVYPGWHDTQTWVHDVSRSFQYASRGRLNPFMSDEIDFAHSAHVVEQIGEQFGQWQNLECRTLKKNLLDGEDQKSQPGRVRLANFYKKGLDNFGFTESVEYLRTLGALDESDPKSPSVIVPNYLYGQSNCLASSSFYAVCCLNECESLFEHLEREIAAPVAEPWMIARLISDLPSDTVEAPRNLPPALLKRLVDIASFHGGSVPLHGRLFAQWMHHAYPRECPFPHLMGEVNPSQDDLGSAASVEEMRLHADSLLTEAIPAELPWHRTEELLQDVVAAPSTGLSKRAFMWIIGGNLVLIIALVSLAVSLIQSSDADVAGFKAFQKRANLKYCV